MFTHVSEWNLWTLDLDCRLTGLVFHHRAKETSWFTFVEPGLAFYEVDQSLHSHGQEPHDHGPSDLFAPDNSSLRLSIGTGVAWAPHKRIMCFMRWGVLFQYLSSASRAEGRKYPGWMPQSWLELDKIRLTGLWKL